MFFMEAMVAARAEMGLDAAQAHPAGGGYRDRRRRAGAGVESAAPRCCASASPPEGGTTHAAISAMENNRVKEHFIAAMRAARARAHRAGTGVWRMNRGHAVPAPPR